MRLASTGAVLVPLGRDHYAVRVASATGLEAIDLLRRSGCTTGPVIGEARVPGGRIAFLVPIGSERYFRRSPHCVYRSSGTWLVLPPLSSGRGAALHWLVPLGRETGCADPVFLAHAIGTAARTIAAGR